MRYEKIGGVGVEALAGMGALQSTLE